MEVKLSENLRKLRKGRNLTQEQLAEVLNVSLGVISKWELGQSTPDLSVIMEMADFFETSVDALLGYTWQSENPAKVVERIYEYIKMKDFDDGIPYVEKAIKKYPNNFDVIYHSAELYFLAASFDRRMTHRTIDLFQDAIRLIGQNIDKHISVETIENRIAMCHSNLGNLDDAVEILKKNNAEGKNEFRIGLILSDVEGRVDEALEHLSIALGLCWSHLFDISIGYAGAYLEKAEYGKLKRLLSWLLCTSEGLRDTGKVHYLDRCDIRILTILAMVVLRENNVEAAKEYLSRAKARAMRFDAAPSYDFGEIYFYHGPKATISYDDMGDTAMDVILYCIKDGAPGNELMQLWEELCNETE